jgi:hypothetical protein
MARLFLDKSVKPDDRLLARGLGRSFHSWETIREELGRTYGTLTPEWKYYGAKSGWTLKILLKKRNLFFFAPFENSFLVAFVFGEKAVRAVGESDLPASVIRELERARKYAEGRGVRIEVKSKKDVKTILALASIKVEHC